MDELDGISSLAGTCGAFFGALRDLEEIVQQLWFLYYLHGDASSSVPEDLDQLLNHVQAFIRDDPPMQAQIARLRAIFVETRYYLVDKLKAQESGHPGARDALLAEIEGRLDTCQPPLAKISRTYPETRGAQVVPGGGISPRVFPEVPGDQGTGWRVKSPPKREKTQFLLGE